MTVAAPIGDAARYEAALRRFDEANAADPNQEMVEGRAHPCELLYARRLSEWVLRLCPDPGEELRLAARCQHLCRWNIPRASYPMTRAGYLRWRTDLKRFHAEKAGQILREVGYPDEMIERVQALNLKRNFPHDPTSRVLEDALCLVFLQYQFAALARKTTADKLVNAVQKCWQKMTPTARAQAVKLPLGATEKALLARALGPGGQCP